MRRRSFLAASTALLAGCSVGPGPPTTAGYPSSPPNFVGAFDWLAGRSAYRVRFAAGNRIVPEQAHSIAVLAGSSDTARTWVGGPEAAAEFPLEPGAKLVLPVEEPHTVRVVWTDPTRERSATLDAWYLEDQPVEASA